MAVLTSLARLTTLGRNCGGALRALAGPPVKIRTADGLAFRTADGEFYGVRTHG